MEDRIQTDGTGKGRRTSVACGGVALSLGGRTYDPDDPIGKMFFNILATFAEFEVDLIRMRTREGMAVARAQGKLKGRQPKLSPKQQRELKRMHETGEYTITDLGELFLVSRPTVYRTINRTTESRRRGRCSASRWRSTRSSDLLVTGERSRRVRTRTYAAVVAEHGKVITASEMDKMTPRNVQTQWTLPFVATGTKFDPDFRDRALAEARKLNAQLRET